MNAARYKLMLSYLPGMAAIVNSFQSPDVQRSVYESLMEALNVRLEAENPGSGGSSGRPRVAASVPLRATIRPAVLSDDSGVIGSDDELAHDLEEGDSIHTLVEQHSTLP